jgi:hypothetical protein
MLTVYIEVKVLVLDDRELRDPIGSNPEYVDGSA